MKLEVADDANLVDQGRTMGFMEFARRGNLIRRNADNLQTVARELADTVEVRRLSDLGELSGYAETAWRDVQKQAEIWPCKMPMLIVNKCRQ